MKKLTILIACMTACILFAQQPALTPPPSASQPPAAMVLPPKTSAALLAGQIITQVTTLLNNVISAIDNGVPAQPPNQSAIDAKDIQAALGAENVMKLRSVAAMLTGQPPASAPSPSPEQK
jgi:hypothetical protein